MSKLRNDRKRFNALRQKLMSAFAMLMIATILMTSTTYAWFVLSTAPEVTGIETQVGANGSLEIALLNTETHADLSTIRAGVGGGSLQEGKMAANNAWGNLVDLSYVEYGLGELILMPARLNTSDGSSVVSKSLLAVPTYGFDGRIIELDKSTGSAILQDGKFLYSQAEQTYGVRAIGSADGTTVQGSYLASAQETVKNSAKKAQSDTRTVLNQNGPDLIGLLMNYALGATMTDTHKAVLENMLTGLEGVLKNIDGALRQSLIAFAASKIVDEAEFELVRGQIMQAEYVKDLLEVVDAPSTAFATWANELYDMQNDLADAQNKCAALSGGSYTKEQINPILGALMNVNEVQINGKKLSELDESLATATTFDVVLNENSGMFADIAKFSGNFSATFSAVGKEVTMTTTIPSSHTPYLTSLYNAIAELTPAVGDNAAPASPLKATFGYAIDLAFRCNAADPDLVLQTKGVQRIYSSDEDTENSGTQGAGSYMEFTSMDAEFTAEQRLALMDAIRVGFVDAQGNILAIAKLNVADRSSENGGVVRAPLYLYDYEFEADEVSGDGMILKMGERRLTDNLITDLDQNVAMAVTAIVWLDGDIVDNTMVSATKATSLNGVLNLQFATSAELVPAGEGEVESYTSDREGLMLAMADAAVVVDAKQGTYTNVSWNNFMDAYNRAENVQNNKASGKIEIDSAIKKLVAAQEDLEHVSEDALQNKINEIREKMGTSPEHAYYVVMDDEGNISLTKNADAENIVGSVYGVDYMGMNVVAELDAEGGATSIRTTKYTDDSWNALAEALYMAEALIAYKDLTDDEINAQLTALELADKNLKHATYFTPYEYQGNLYYMANYAKDATDTYGRWYDSEFKMVVSDVTILKLDAYAGIISIAEMGQAQYVSNNTPYLTPDIRFLQEVFPELKNVKPKGIHWSAIDTELFIELMGDAHKRAAEDLLAYHDENEILNYEAGATAERAAVASLLEQYASGDVPVETARTTINAYKAALAALYEANEQKKAEAEPGYIATNLLPAALTVADVEFDVPYTGTKLKLTGETGTTTLKAKVLTENGVVIDVAADITIYVKAEDAELNGGVAVNLAKDATVDVAAALIFADGVSGNCEGIKSIRWASEDTKVATVSAGATAEAATIKAVEKGTTIISGTVTTDMGNTYSISVTVTVTE